jgi:hypothetical protein
MVRLGRERCGSLAAGLASGVFFPLIYVFFGQNSAQPESFQIPFIIWAMALWPGSPTADRASMRCFSSGLLLSAGILYKTPAVLFAVPLLLDRLIQDRRLPALSGKLRLTLVTLAGMAVLPSLMVTYYAARGAWAPMVDALIDFPARYALMSADIPSNYRWKQSRNWVRWLLSIPAIILILHGFVRGVVLRRGDTARWLGASLAGWGTLVIQSRFYDYHHELLVPFVAWGMGLGFCGPLGDAPRPGGWRFWLNQISLTGAAILTAVAIIQYSYGVRHRWEYAGPIARSQLPEGVPLGGVDAMTDVEISQLIRATTTKEETIFVWGDEPSIYFLSDRRMAGPYCQLLQIIPPWSSGERLRPLIGRLLREKPRLVIIPKGYNWWRVRWNQELLDEFPEMREFIYDYYKHFRKLGRYEVWIRAD